MLCFVWLFWQWLIFLLDLCRFALICFTLRWFVLLALSPLLGFGFRLYSWLVLMCCVWLCFVYCFDLFHLRSFYCLCFVCFTEQVDLQVDLVGWLVVGWLVDLTGWLLIVFFCFFAWLAGWLVDWPVGWLSDSHVVSWFDVSVSCSCRVCRTFPCRVVPYRVIQLPRRSFPCHAAAVPCCALPCRAFIMPYVTVSCHTIAVSWFSVSCVRWRVVVCRVLPSCHTVAVTGITVVCRVLQLMCRAFPCHAVDVPCFAASSVAVSYVTVLCRVVCCRCRAVPCVVVSCSCRVTCRALSCFAMS